jgi:hypothetical protein
MSCLPFRLAALAALLLALPLSACARGERLLEVQVLDADRGNLLEVLPFRGRDYLAGEPGHRFAVSLRNVSGERVLAVLSVDGVNAISGQTAAASQAGYVLEPWQQVEIRGWRKSHAEIAEFYFTDLPDSYAARTGRPDNVGVIGVAAFRERRVAPPAYYAPPSTGYPPPPAPPIAMPASPYERSRKSSADAAGRVGDRAMAESAAPSVQRQQLGTGHGERRYDPVAQTQFERDSRWPNQRIALYYDSWEALAARGVIRTQGIGEPDPFPLGFVPDPR